MLADNYQVMNDPHKQYSLFLEDILIFKDLFFIEAGSTKNSTKECIFPEFLPHIKFLCDYVADTAEEKKENDRVKKFNAISQSIKELECE